MAKNKRDEENQAIASYEFNPTGTDNELPRLIGNMMHQRVLDEGIVTLANMGYYDIVTLMYNIPHNEVKLRVYFYRDRVARVVRSETSNSRMLRPVDELRIFENYLYVGNLEDVVTYEKVYLPKAKFVEDDLGKPSIVIEDDAKLVSTDALVLNCSLPVTIAASLNVSLLDPNFEVKCSSVAKGTKKAEKSIITMGGAEEIPLILKATASYNGTGYDPDEIGTYFKMLEDRAQNGYNNSEKLRHKVKDKAKKAEKKAKRAAQSSGFLKYS